jgi:hypothetical protein
VCPFIPSDLSLYTIPCFIFLVFDLSYRRNDISADYGTIVDRIDLNDKWAVFTGPGRWADPDMIQCGNGRLTAAECRTNFGLWAVTKSPLILGTNVAHLSQEILSIILNKGVIAINQDPLGVQATKRSANGAVSPKFVGLGSCAATNTEPGVNGVSVSSLQWQLQEKSAANSTYSVYHPGTNRCLATRPYIGRKLPVPVLLPCSPNDPTQTWAFPRVQSVGGIINEALNLALTAGDSTVYGAVHGSDSMPLPDQAYGLTNLTFTPYAPEPPCNNRNCDNYVPQQSFYFSPTTGKIALSLMASNIYRCFEGSCYVLTSHYPTTVDLCLSHVASISNDGKSAVYPYTYFIRRGHKRTWSARLGWATLRRSFRICSRQSRQFQFTGHHLVFSPRSARSWSFHKHVPS